jgi:hypothetical protein
MLLHCHSPGWNATCCMLNSPSQVLLKSVMQHLLKVHFVHLFTATLLNSVVGVSVFHHFKLLYAYYLRSHLLPVPQELSSHRNCTWLMDGKTQEACDENRLQMHVLSHIVARGAAPIIQIVPKDGRHLWITSQEYSYIANEIHSSRLHNLNWRLITPAETLSRA